jgi:murein DD-endopeptidase MepM/ murein hydrolase activator NlpD
VQTQIAGQLVIKNWQVGACCCSTDDVVFRLQFCDRDNQQSVKHGTTPMSRSSSVGDLILIGALAAVVVSGGAVTAVAATAPTQTVAATSSSFRWPVDGPLNIKGEYLEARPKGKKHQGVDLAEPEGTAVHAAKEGKVVKADGTSDPNGYGNWIILQHSDGWQTYYAHLSRFNVKVGDEVTQGSTIGAVGNTGHSYGNHLHFETRQNGHTVNPHDVVKP